MLTDTKLKNLRGADKLYKVADRDGLYVAVTPTGVVSFRLDYRLNGRRETLTIGKYGPAGIGLAEAREKCLAAKKQIAEGKSPAQEKQRARSQVREAKTFGEWAKRWLKEYKMAESTRDMRESVLNRDVLPLWANRLMTEISPEDLRKQCDKIIDERGAPATAVHVREIVNQIYRYALGKGLKATNPAAEVRASTIATFKPKDRALSPEEIGIFIKQLEHVGTLPTIKLALRLLLLTMLRKGELQAATWEEVDFRNAVWTVPAERMKGRRPHNVYLSQQALDILIALKTCAGSSPYLLSNRYDTDKPMSKATLNRSITVTVELAQKKGLALEHFGPHDMRRTASTILHEAGFNTDWIEKCLAHEQRGVRAVYNKAEYAEQRRDMLQQWADMVDDYVAATV